MIDSTESREQNRDFQQYNTETKEFVQMEAGCTDSYNEQIAIMYGQSFFQKALDWEDFPGSRAFFCMGVCLNLVIRAIKMKILTEKGSHYRGYEKT